MEEDKKKKNGKEDMVERRIPWWQNLLDPPMVSLDKTYGEETLHIKEERK